MNNEVEKEIKAFREYMDSLEDRQEPDRVKIKNKGRATGEEWTAKELLLDIFQNVDVPVILKVITLLQGRDGVNSISPYIIECALWEGVDRDKINSQNAEGIKKLYEALKPFRGMRECETCQELKPFDEFVKDNRLSRGIAWECRPCRNNRQRENRKKGRDGNWRG